MDKLTGYEMLFGVGWLGVVTVGYGLLVLVLAWAHYWASKDRL